MFSSLVFSSLCFCCLTAFADADEVKSVSVTEGDSVSLESGQTELQEEDVITWEFDHSKTGIARIALINKEANSFNTSDGDAVGFRDRLKLDHQTGSLTITNARTTDSGLYQVTINSGQIPKRFRVTVYAHLPVPVIIRNSSQCLSSSSSSLQKCSVLCSVVNVSHVTLSWLKGNSLFSNISVSKLSSILSLPLEVEDQDTNNYSCVINNSISNRTTHISGLCQPCPARLPVPVISKACSSPSSCVVVCSVANVSHVTLSWLKGNSLLSSISVSDLSISLSLPLEVDDQDTNNYRCVVKSSITHQTTHLDISALYQPCPGGQCCDSVEAAMRLVVTVLMGVAAAAAVVLLVNDIKSTRTQSS